MRPPPSSTQLPLPCPSLTKLLPLQLARLSHAPVALVREGGGSTPSKPHGPRVREELLPAWDQVLGAEQTREPRVAPQMEMPPCFGEVLLGAWAGVLRVEWCRAGIWREGEEYTWVFQSQLPKPLTSWVPTPEGCVSQIFPLSEQRPVREKVGPAWHPTPRPGGTTQNTSVAPAILTWRPG